MTSGVLYHSAFISVFHRRFQHTAHPPSPPHSPCLSCSVLSKLVARKAKIERGRERDEAKARVQEEEKVCGGMYVDGTSHGGVCPGFDTVRACCKTRANKDGCCLKKEVHFAPLSARCGGGGFCLQRTALNIFPEFLQTSRGSFFLCFFFFSPPVCLCEQSCLAVFCVLGARGNQLLTHYK